MQRLVMKISWSEFRSLRKSFVYAIRGVLYCVGNERNMRVHIAVAANVLLFSTICELSGIEYGLLFFTIGLVLMCEMINTSIETLVNLGSPTYHTLARIAKDVSAGAVLVAAAVSVVVGLCIFLQTERIFSAFSKIFSNPLLIILFFVSIIGGLIFVFKGFKIKLPKKSEKIGKVKIYKPEKKNNI